MIPFHESAPRRPAVADPLPVAQLPGLAARIRLHAVRMVAMHGLGYLGQALSSAEGFAVLYGRYYRPGTDRLVVSPGHYVIAAFAAAAERGMLDDDELRTYGHNGSRLEAIGTERAPAVDLTCGSLGQGLSAAVGFALADRLQGRPDSRTLAVVSDGELEEGQLWEAAMFAGHHRLGALTVLLDANDSQVDGPVTEITTVEPIADKWRSFGWDARDVDGHDAAVDHAVATDRPAIVIARTSTRHGLETVGPDRVLLGSDHPYPLGEQPPGEVIRTNPGLSATEKAALLRGNARTYLGLAD
ncbi:1-deoxy-D-xylulose-5-phosphate synthase N-terminal domain-containing protein [Solwaraspora sp. WMMB335]|uniref:1-deoxy-D-xylulose-5-phosphate synthase N-terminal domain-containing protein n=1 Tax=Solwaraspora sp. WMMB335 TaxID=3404118 RepID=UPI003B9332F9